MVRFIEDDDGESPDSRSAAPELAPVIPLFGGVHVASIEPEDSVDDQTSEAMDREDAEHILLKRLRTRQLSVSEAGVILAQRGLGAEEVDSVLADFLRLGYLNDAGLAEQLIHVGTDRKGQGRQAIAQTLAKRGIPRDVADAALATLPDDDFERALEYARSKARSLASVDRETAVRRLAGQLARRGYRGSVALTAAQTALDESTTGLRGVAFR